MNFEEALKLLPKGKAILFTGSGFSFGAKNMRKCKDGSSAEFRSAGDIAKDLALIAGLIDETNPRLGDVAQYCKDNTLIGELLSFLKDEFTVRQISELHRKIGMIPWRRSYTTNYDTIIEQAHRLAGNRCETVTMGHNINEVGIKNACIHINGCIDNLNTNTLDREFKLTNRSYLDDGVLFTEWFAKFKEDLLSASVVIFIGFSGDYDLDLKRVFQNTKELREKTFFIVHQTASTLQCHNLKDFGEVLKIGLDGFVEKCEATGVFNKSVNQEDEEEAFAIRCFRSPESEYKKRSVKASDFISLITLGELDPGLLNLSVREPRLYPYYIYRERIDGIIERIDKGTDNILILSNLGNGKTLLMEGLAVSLKRKGFSPYIFEKEREFITDEIRYICENTRNPVILIDNYLSNFGLIKKISRMLDDGIPLILTDRTARYETSLHRISELNRTFCIYNIDSLSNPEIKHLTSLFTKYGLWDELASRSDDEKCQYIARNCKGILSLFLLSRLNASQIRSSYQSVITAIKEKKEYYEVLLFILFMKYFDFKIEYGSLLETIGTHVMNNSGFINNPNVKEVIDFQQETIKFNSGILAQHILTTYINKNELAEYIITLFLSLDKKVSGNRKLRQIMRSLMQYRNLNQLLKSNGLIYKIYESISDCNYCKEHPLFWLQCAIAKTADGQYSIAAHNFATSYSHAEKRKFDTFQIDNHYAHFLLKRAIDQSELGRRQPIEIFREAHKKLSYRRNGDELKHYIYKVAADYKPFVDKYRSKLSCNDMQEIKTACKQIIDMAEDFISLPGASETKMVKETIASLNEIIVM